MLTNLFIGLSLAFACVSYACVFADPDTALGRLRTRALHGLLRGAAQLLGQKRLARLSQLLEHAFQLAYLVAVLGSWCVMFAYGYPQIEASNFLHSHHRYAGYVLFALSLGSWHYACYVGPGTVTARTMPLFDHYDYDNVLYADRLCPTLQIRKIARSKYDRATGRHVPRFDHFCGWLNQAVGERNYRWFLLFLAIHVGMCCYGTWAMATVLYGEVIEKQLLRATFFNAATGEEVPASRSIVFHYLFARHFQICGVLLLMSVMAVMLGLFLAFHLYITSRNMTTNEFFKWRSVRHWHKTERRKHQQALKEGKTGAKSSAGTVSEQVPDGDVGCMGPAISDSSPQVIADDEVVDPGPMPRNIYDKGIIQNFVEVLYPLSFSDEATQRLKTALHADTDKCSTKLNSTSEEKKTI